MKKCIVHRHLAPLTFLAALVLGVYLPGCDRPDPHWLASFTPPADLVGQWSGEARIYNNCTTQRSLGVSIRIGADGSVSGRVGDATLVDARVAPNRGAIGRALNLGTDYIIVCKLKGPLIASEGITRDAASMPFNLVNGRLAGGFASGGSWFGGKDRVVIAAGMVLMPAQSPTSQPASP